MILESVILAYYWSRLLKLVFGRMVDLVGIPSVVLVAVMPLVPVKKSSTHGVICDIRGVATQES